MAAGTDLTVILEATISWTDTLSLGGTKDPQDVGRFQFRRTLLNGKTANRIDRHFHDRRVINTATPNDDLDLVGGLTDSWGRTLNFTSIRGIYVRNLGLDNGDGTFSQVATDDIQIGGAGATAFVNWIDSTASDGSEFITLPTNGVFMVTSPFEGWAVAGGSDILRITHSGTSANLTYDIALWGVT